jgi:hypothetical protein
VEYDLYLNCCNCCLEPTASHSGIGVCVYDLGGGYFWTVIISDSYRMLVCRSLLLRNISISKYRFLWIISWELFFVPWLAPRLLRSVGKSPLRSSSFSESVWECAVCRFLGWPYFADIIQIFVQVTCGTELGVLLIETFRKAEIPFDSTAVG